MQQDARHAYLETQVNTATPQKLRLMLIERAIQMAHQTIEHWSAARNEEGCESLIRCRAVVAELLSSIKPEHSSLTKSTSNIYLFLFQSLSQAQSQYDIQRLHDVIEVLQVERETWSQVCQRMPAAPEPSMQQPASKEITDSSATSIPPMNSSTYPTISSSNLSWDA